MLRGAIGISTLEQCIAARDSAFLLLQENQQKEDENRLKDFLEPFDYRKNLKEIESNTCEGTARWMFDNPVLNQWMDNEHLSRQRIVWLVGIPGAGNASIYYFTALYDND